MYRSYSYNNMPRPITNYPAKPPDKREKEEKKTEEPDQLEETKKAEAKKTEAKSLAPIGKKADNNSFLDNLQTDDIILIMVVIALLLDNCDDKLLLAALAFVFISDFF